MIQIDMEMPKNCYECKYNLCVHYNGIWADDNNRDINCTNSRHKDCPLKEVNDKSSGKWEIHDDGILAHLLVCSNCGNEINITEAVHLDYYKKHFKYCPNCGAKMESGDKADE